MSVAQADCSQQLSLPGATYADAKTNTGGEVGARGVATPFLCFLTGLLQDLAARSALQLLCL